MHSRAQSRGIAGLQVGILSLSVQLFDMTPSLQPDPLNAQVVQVSIPMVTIPATLVQSILECYLQIIT